MDKIYQPVNWRDGKTKLNAKNLNQMDEQIQQNDESIRSIKNTNFGEYDAATGTLKIKFPALSSES